MKASTFLELYGIYMRYIQISHSALQSEMLNNYYIELLLFLFQSINNLKYNILI